MATVSLLVCRLVQHSAALLAWAVIFWFVLVLLVFVAGTLLGTETAGPMHEGLKLAPFRWRRVDEGLS